MMNTVFLFLILHFRAAPPKRLDVFSAFCTWRHVVCCVLWLVLVCCVTHAEGSCSYHPLICVPLLMSPAVEPTIQVVSSFLVKPHCMVFPVRLSCTRAAGLSWACTGEWDCRAVHFLSLLGDDRLLLLTALFLAGPVHHRLSFSHVGRLPVEIQVSFDFIDLKGPSP